MKPLSILRRINSLWLQQQELTASNPASFARFGLSVTMNDDTIAVGADGNSKLGFFSGVAVSNNTVLVGALGKSDVAFNAGASYIYEL